MFHNYNQAKGHYLAWIYMVDKEFVYAKNSNIPIYVQLEDGEKDEDVSGVIHYTMSHSSSTRKINQIETVQSIILSQMREHNEINKIMNYLLSSFTKEAGDNKMM